MAQRKATCVKFAKTCLAAAVAFAFALFAATTAVADEDLNGGTQSITTADGLKGKTWINGTLNVSANQTLADATTTLGSGLTVNQTSGWWGLAGTTTLNINGATVNYTSTSTPYFGKRASNEGTYGGTTSVSLNNGKFICSSTDIKFTARASSTTDNRDVVISFTMANNSEMAVPSDKNITFGGMEQANSKKHKTLKMTASVADSKITAKQIVLGQNNVYLTNTGSSTNNITFGSGADLTVGQIYAYTTPAPTVKFNGATIHWAGTSYSLIGQNSSLSGDFYEIQSGGLTIDIPSGKSLTIDNNGSALKGAGGITKIGAGSITWDKITSSSSSKKMTFTGPLVVSNGTWSSTKDYAASAFRAEGGNLTLSGALSASSVVLSATDGGVLTLAGAKITDDSPDLTLASGGSTDYFTRDSVVSAYTLDTFTLGAGGILSLDANATDVDAISVTTTNITATAANPATINLHFTAAPAAGATFALFETDDAAKFNVNPTFGSVALPHEVAVVNGALTLTIIADDYTWNGSGTSWGDTGAWTLNSAAADWSAGNNAIFATANATATLAADAFASEVRFTADATVSGSSTLTAASVDVASGVAATISAPTAGSLEKTGAGTLTLGTSRTEQTTVTEGTLAMANGAMVDATKLTLGTDAAKAVTFDYGGQTLAANPATYVGGGMNVTLMNGDFTHDSIYGLDAGNGNFPSVLTVASGATVQGTTFNWNTRDGSGSINIAGGNMKTINNSNNWIMQKSLAGSLDINITNGGLLEFSGEAYMLTCRDAVDGSTAYESPKLNMKVVDSTVRVKNGKSLRFGLDDEMKPSATPEFTLAATNSVFDIAYGFYLGNNPVEGRATGGFYKEDFENCIITAKQFRVYNGRPLNRVRLNNSQIVFNVGSSEISATSGGTTYDGDAKWITVDAGGLTIDNQTYAASLNANLGGSGAVTKIGTGKLTVAVSQTSSAALNVNEGALALAGGITVERPLVFADGTTLDVTGTSSASIASLTFPAEGTVTLTMNGGAFAKGKFKILEKSGIAVADVQYKLVPSTGALEYEWSVTGDTLYLAVDNPPANFWTGLGGDGKMSTAANWAGGAVPAANSDLDFSGVPSGTTIDADAGYAFGAVTMGDQRITFTGSLTATSFSDTSKIAVGANATVTLDGDLRFSNTSATTIIYSAAAGGRFVVTGDIELTSSATAELKPFAVNSAGAIVAKGLVHNVDNNDTTIFRLAHDAEKTTCNWIIGKHGFSGSKRYWVFSRTGLVASIQAYDSDFSIKCPIGNREGASLTLNTTGDDRNAHTITIGNGGYIYREGTVNVKGTGTVLCDYANSGASNPFNVESGATLALKAGANLGTGAVTVNNGAALEVAESAATAGTAAVTLGGNLDLKDGATLKFNFTDRREAPVLKLTDKTVTFGNETNITVSVNGSVRPVYGSDGKFFLTSGGGFPAPDVTVAKADDCASWVKDVGIENGDLYAEIANGLVVIVK